MKHSRPWTWGLLGGLLLSALGCGEAPGPGPGASNVRLDEGRYLGAELEVDNLAIWPVYADRILDLGEYLTLEEAEARGLAHVREVGAAAPGTSGADLPQAEAQAAGPELAPTEAPAPLRAPVPTAQVADALQQVASLDAGGATVGTLVIASDADLPILVLAGTVVKGGQQDRQIGQDLVIAAHSVVPVEAFCVEPGRWQTRAGADGGAFEQRGLGLAVKSVRLQAQYAKDQGGVWAEVREVLGDRGIQATSTFVAAVEEEEPEARARRAAVEKAVLGHFASLASVDPAPVGFAYAVNGEIQTVRAFAHPRLLAGHLPAYARAMALECELARDGQPKAVSAEGVVAFVRSIAAAQERIDATGALNWNGIRAAERGYNASCYVADPSDAARKAVLTADWTAR